MQRELVHLAPNRCASVRHLSGLRPAFVQLRKRNNLLQTKSPLSGGVSQVLAQ